MDEQAPTEQTKDTLESFLDLFNKYAEEVFGERRRGHLDVLRTKLQRLEPQVTKMLLGILGDRVVGVAGIGRSVTLSISDLLPTALMGGNNEEKHNFYDFKGPVTAILTRALGAIETGLWPPKEPTPVLVIKDNELRNRCLDLLRASTAYDRVIREATTVLEDRIRKKPPHATLARLIPQAADQTGENLVNKLLSPDKPVLVISAEKQKRIAFHRIMLGVFSYLRNPYHHKLNPLTEWSWAWSTVGLVDRLLAEIDYCSVTQ